jgi:uncharacterized protein
MSLRETGEGVIISIFVKPNSPKFKIELDGGEVVVYATEEPERGKVNKEILKELTKLFHIQVEFVSGMTSKQKVLLLRGANKAQIEAAIQVCSKQ